ncbi:MAG: hypothetical protein ACP5UQ_16535 [Anaerolineae bacterium]
MTPDVRRIAHVAWIALAFLTGLMVLSGILFPAWIGILLLLPALTAWAVLLIIHHRWLASWRAILLIWSGFGVLRVATTRPEFGDGPLDGAVVTLLAVFGFYTLIAGYAALIALIVRRDVSIAYVFLPIALGAPIMLVTVQAAGGVMEWFDAFAMRPTFERALILEPLLLSLSCMGTLGFIAVVPHMVVTVVREVRGNTGRHPAPLVTRKSMS